VATLLTITFLVAISSPGRALELDRSPAEVAAVAATTAVINPPAGKAVPPALDMSDDPTVSPDEVRAVNPVVTSGTGFASLAAAVAAVDTPGDASGELSCLASAVYFESKGEPLSGQLAVANVIINRSTSGRFPGSICGVVKQPGQFSFVRGGAIPAVRSGAQYRTAMAIAQIAMDGKWDNPAPNALYFHARRVSPGWNRPRVATIGNHVFFR
jgi:N-acetylmuramoyl-L-alanine amidase